MNTLAGVLLLLHAFANFVGFLGAWRLSPEIPYPGTVLAGRIHISDSTVKLMGAVWMAVAAAFFIAGFGALARMPGWSMLALGAASASAALCIIDWPETKVGLTVNASIIAIILAVQWAGIPLVHL